MERTGKGELGTARMDAAQWSDRASREILQQLADSVTETVGFGVAVINAIRGDIMTTVTVSSDRPEIAERLLGARTPAPLILAELERAETWGRFRFVPHDRVELDIPAWGWRSESVHDDRPGAWHNDDLLFAPLYSQEGELIGLLSTDGPLDGLRPGPKTRDLLDRYAEHAERALRSAIQRDEHAQQVRLIETARHLVRTASSQPTLEKVLEECREPLVLGFRSLGTWIQVFDAHGTERGQAVFADGSLLDIPPEIVAIARHAATDLWSQQEAAVLGADYAPNPILSPVEHDSITQFLGSLGIASVMFVPLGAGQDTFGILVLGRWPEDPYWSRVETVSALDIGRDLGAAILNARAFETKRHLIEDLQTLDAYKSQLIATVSHELKNPLTAIMGHLELLAGFEELSPATQLSIAAMDRSTQRLTGLVDDLLLLAQVDSGARRTLASVDLGQLTSRALDRATNDPDAPAVRLVAPGGITVQGNETDLTRMMAALLDNAMHYGGEHIEVQVKIRGSDVILEVIDQGLGISFEDQGLIFNEFFRSSDPTVTEIVGSGLGLSIASRVAKQHGGSIRVKSILGQGSTFTITLPREHADADSPNVPPAIRPGFGVRSNVDRTRLGSR